MRNPSRTTALALAVAVQAALVVVAVAPRLSARVLGDTYALRVEPVDPIDPFRGAYVTLRYPDLQAGSFAAGPDRRLFLPLVRDGSLWKGERATTTRPRSGPYIACALDGDLTCGIESLFLPQSKAAALERDLADGGVARIKVDARGNASVLDVRA